MRVRFLRVVSGATLAMTVFGVAACGPAAEAPAQQAAVSKPDALEARAIEVCRDLVQWRLMSENSAAQSYLARQAMGRDIGSSALLNADGKYRALVMRRATGEDGCSTLITAACLVSVTGEAGGVGFFTVSPTFTRECD